MLPPGCLRLRDEASFSPKGINNPAQGCVKRATLGKMVSLQPIPEGD